jgi:hypothetical protein
MGEWGGVERQIPEQGTELAALGTREGRAQKLGRDDRGDHDEPFVQ